MSWAAVAIGGASLVGGMMAQSSANDRANAASNRAFQEFLKINIPDPNQQKLALQRFVVQGTLTPELEHAIKQQPTEFQKIAVDQSQKNAQSRALSSLEQVGNQGGLRLQDKAALQDAMMKGQVQDRGNRQAISDEMARRGQGGSGFDLQAQLQGQQASGDRAAQSGLTVAAQAQDRALKAIEGAGDLATKYRGQDFQEQSARAQAQDAINRFNTQNLQGVQSNNVNALNRAQEMNLAQRQKTSDQNVGVSNQEQQYNKELLQKNYENQMRMAESKAGIYNQQGQNALREGQQASDTWGKVGAAGVGAAASYNNRQNAKTASAPSNSSYYSTPDSSGETFDDETNRKRANSWNLGDLS